MFNTGLLYRRRSLHGEYGGQQQGGISTPSYQNFIFLFSSPRAKEFGYEDGWSEEGIYLYTGEGQRGDMAFTRGNSAIRDHQKEGKDLHLFEASSKKGFYRYVGQMFCIGFHEHQGKDIMGKQRSQIVFELIPIDRFIAEEMNTEIEKKLWQESLHDLRNRALSHSSSPTTSQRQVEIYNRSQAVKIYALKRANGTCEGCQKKAPFVKEDGRPYLEVHHLNRLSDGGPDHPESVIALCPNCHRQAHYSSDRELFNARLTRVVAKIEAKKKKVE